MTSPTTQTYHIREMNEAEFTPFFQKYSREIFYDAYQSFRLKNTFTEEETRQNTELAANMGAPYTLRLGVFDENNRFIGWHWGFQESALKFYMCNSAVLPEFRNRGIYTELVKKAIGTAAARGFQTIYSRHHPTNNADHTQAEGGFYNHVFRA